MMKVAIMQPYFLPYMGYWQLLNAVDTFVIYDDVNYIKRGWVNRNRLLENGEAAYFNVYIDHASQNRLINETERLMNQSKQSKLVKRIVACYEKAPFFHETYPIIEKIILDEERNLAVYLEKSIKYMADYMGVTTSIIKSSDIQKEGNLKGQDKILDICKRLGAGAYYNPIGGMELYSKDRFAMEKIKLFFLEMEDIKYDQFENEFVPSLSILDVLMFNGKRATQQYLSWFKLI